ncbi:hypothetical protein HHK36_025289 [Tetracentron sinense]|uniref:Nudix hydrolase domain-containing protein n=1 Tax=Tetracentron sinense TaxID=13715 RepID=A0A834YLV8_TETSI|nr:hypothetical protein HHK36_025289 [Tetracentron sinense]
MWEREKNVEREIERVKERKVRESSARVLLISHHFQSVGEFVVMKAAAFVYLNRDFLQIIMSSLLARTGRDRQRYEGRLRLVAGCIPYRLEKDGEDYSCDLGNRLKVLMISSPNRNDLVFPKGGWEDDETVGEAACREALEEAGVKGILDEKHLGVWEFRSKSRQNSCSLEGGCKGYMFALEVTEELDSWPEQDNHERKWVSMQKVLVNYGIYCYSIINVNTTGLYSAHGTYIGLTIGEALELCRYDWMRNALEKFLSKVRTHETREKLVGPPSVPVKDVVSEHQRLLPSCSVKPSGTQHLDKSYNKCIVQG